MGTALEIAARGHRVTIVTAWTVPRYFLRRTELDKPARARLKATGGTWITEAAVKEWTPQGARVLHMLDGTEELLPADSLVLATTIFCFTMARTHRSCVGFV